MHCLLVCAVLYTDKYVTSHQGLGSRVSVLWGPGVHDPFSLTVLTSLDPLIFQFCIVLDYVDPLLC